VLRDDEQEAWDRLRELYGGDPSERILQMTIVGTPEQCVERLRPYADLGVGDFLLAALAPFDEQTVELVAKEVAPALRAAVAA
jgi:alkanesulfonate monooxygenase SsuD/methylene tetrahydromethanopterin reductase-like flavin-dependent oxidoreductase (luciferase family)